MIQLQMALPNIRSEPEYTMLTRALESLKLLPRNWSDEPIQSQLSPAVEDAVVQRFSMSIVSSSLDWLASEERDVVYDMASKRIAERCGRSGYFSLFFAVC